LPANLESIRRCVVFECKQAAQAHGLELCKKVGAPFGGIEMETLVKQADVIASFLLFRFLAFFHRPLL
jgi:hypothetical protein